jgi:hypothetical protein
VRVGEGKGAYLGWVMAHPARARRRVRAARVFISPKAARRANLLVVWGGKSAFSQVSPGSGSRSQNGLLIVENPEPVPRSPNKLRRVNGAERRKAVRALSGSKRLRSLSGDRPAHSLLTQFSPLSFIPG